MSSTKQIEIVLPERHPGQQQIADSEARFKVVMCGRQWGKTKEGITTACEGIIRGEKWGWFSPSYKFSTEVWRALCQTLEPIITKKQSAS